MSENELQARRQGFFGNRGGCAGAHGAVESVGQQAAPLLEFLLVFLCGSTSDFSNEASPKSKRSAATAVATIGDFVQRSD